MRRGAVVLLFAAGCSAPDVRPAPEETRTPATATGASSDAPPADAGPPGASAPGSEAASTADALDDAPRLLGIVVPLVEAACGARFRAPPRVAILSEEDAVPPFAEDLRPEVERRYAQATEGQRATMLRVAASNAARSCVARYSVSAKTIVLVRSGFERQRAGLDVPAGRLLLASLCHEAVHALDDERFDLAKLYREARDDEALRARAMLVEGRATHFGRTAASHLGVPPGDDALFLPGGREVKGEREWMLRMTYALGERFVAERGVEAADRAVASPPDLTWHLCEPSRWPDARPDPRPFEVFEAAGLAAGARPISDLQLRVRYTALDGAGEAEALLAGYRGGAQVFDGTTNAAVLAFADEPSAAEFEKRLLAAASPVQRVGTIVLRAEGADATGVLGKLGAAARER